MTMRALTDSELLANVTQALVESRSPERPDRDEAHSWIESLDKETGQSTWQRRDLFDEWTRLQLKLRGAFFFEAGDQLDPLDCPAMILFLDFDGVTHPQPCGDENVFCQLHLIEAVLRERELQGVHIVISSSWREYHRGPPIVVSTQLPELVFN